MTELLPATCAGQREALVLLTWEGAALSADALARRMGTGTANTLALLRKLHGRRLVQSRVVRDGSRNRPPRRWWPTDEGRLVATALYGWARERRIL